MRRKRVVVAQKKDPQDERADRLDSYANFVLVQPHGSLRMSADDIKDAKDKQHIARIIRNRKKLPKAIDNP